MTSIQAAQAPSKPPSPKYVSSTSSSISLSFQEPSDNGGSLITSYTLEMRELPSYTFTPVATYDGTSMQDTLTVADDGLSTGEIYAFRITATNDAGDSVYSDELQVACESLPAAPANLRKVDD